MKIYKVTDSTYEVWWVPETSAEELRNQFGDVVEVLCFTLPSDCEDVTEHMLAEIEEY